MKRINRIFAVFLLFLFGINLVYSLNQTTLTIIPIKDKIYDNETAEFKIIINENGYYSFDVPLFSYNWFYYTDPSSIYFYPHQFKKGDEFYIYLKPMKVEPKIYVFSLIVKDEAAAEQNKTVEEMFPLRIYIIPKPVKEEVEEYPLMVNVQTSMEKNKFYPGQTVVFDFYIENKNPRYVGKVELKVDNEFYSIQKTYDLKPKTKDAPVSNYKIYEVFSFNLPEKQIPKNSTLVITVKYGQESYVKKYNFEILPVESFRDEYYVNESIVWKHFLLERNYTIKLINEGNVPVKFYKSVGFGKPSKYINSTTLVNTTHFIIDEEVPPYSEKVHFVHISYKEYYKKLIYTAAISIGVILLLIILILLFRAPFTFTKSVVKSYLKEGYLYITFELSFKNRSSKSFDNVVIKEKLPLNCEYVHKPGALEPEILRTQNHLVLKWNLGNIDPKDERIISYTLKFKLQIFGKTIFNAAELFYTRKNKTFKIISNELLVDL
ncbi:MAG: hypothetical protein QXS41_02085 [Candidatus Woesearchaeota archaeon]